MTSCQPAVMCTNPGDAGAFGHGRAGGQQSYGLGFTTISRREGRLRKRLLEEESMQSLLTQSCDGGSSQEMMLLCDLVEEGPDFGGVQRDCSSRSPKAPLDGSM